MTAATLVCVNHDRSVPVIPLQRLPLTLGRGEEADFQIADQCASRLHCRIVEVENQLIVQDLGSALGTLVNGQPIAEAPLNVGDRLTVGVLTFCLKKNLLSRFRGFLRKLGMPLRERPDKVTSS